MTTIEATESVLAESPTLLNRVWRAVKREALHMWGDGAVDYMDIDRAWMIFTSNRNGRGRSA